MESGTPHGTVARQHRIHRGGDSMTDLLDRPAVAPAPGAAASPLSGAAASPLSGAAAASVDEVVGRLEAIQAHLHVHTARRTRDGLACFNRLYTVITKTVRQWIAEGRFADAEFLTALDVAFANRYFDALRAYEADARTAPSSWRALLERRSDWQVSRMRFAVAGVNAHVNFDLPFALVDACTALATDLDEGSQRADYELINDIFALRMQGLRLSYESGLVRWIDEHLLGRVENVFDDFAVDKARDAAWAHAEVLWAIRTDPVAMKTYECGLDSVVGLAGRGVLAHL